MGVSTGAYINMIYGHIAMIFTGKRRRALRIKNYILHYNEGGRKVLCAKQKIKKTSIIYEIHGGEGVCKALIHIYLYRVWRTLNQILSSSLKSKMCALNELNIRRLLTCFVLCVTQYFMYGFNNVFVTYIILCYECNNYKVKST